MLRTVITSLSKASWAQGMIMRWGFSRRAASRFVAGETREDALAAVRSLNALGIRATLDNLGENTSSEAEAGAAADEMITLLDDIDRSGVQANISIKLSQMGLLLSEEICWQNLNRILTAAAKCGNFVRIDMEDSSVTQATINLFRRARGEGFENVGLVLQACLYRTGNDMEQLLELDARIRLCKGAYLEPAAIAFPKKKDVDAVYDRLVTLALTHIQANVEQFAGSSDGRIPPLLAAATHDPRRIVFAQALSQRLGLPASAVEYQMLYGIRRDLQQMLAAKNYAVRVYVPYGTRWYPYLMRRLAERPANLWFILSNLMRK